MLIRLMLVFLIKLVNMLMVFDLLLMQVIIVFGRWFFFLRICVLVFLLIMCWNLCIIVGNGCGLVVVFSIQCVFLQLLDQLCSVLLQVFFSVVELLCIGIILVFIRCIWNMFGDWCLMFLVFMQIWYFRLSRVLVSVEVMLCWLVLVLVIILVLFICLVSRVWFSIWLVLCVLLCSRFLCFRYRVVWVFLVRFWYLVRVVG